MNIFRIWWAVGSVATGLLSSGASAGQVLQGYAPVAATHSAKCLRILDDATSEDSRVVQSPCEGSPQDQWTLEHFEDGFYRVVLRATGQCLSVYRESGARGAALVQSRCRNRGHQLWKLLPQNGGVRLRARHSGQCADVLRGTRWDETPLIQWPCGSQPNQVFMFDGGVLAPDARAALVGRHSGLCLTVQNSASQAGAGIVQSSCNGAAGAHQRWQLRPVDDGHHLVVEHSGLCLRVPDASTEAGAKLVQEPCDSGTAQRWRLQAQRGAYRLRAAHSDKCLAVDPAAAPEGAAVAQVECTDATHQQWTLAAPSRPSQWSPLVDFSIVPVAAAHLPDGKLLTWASYDRLNFGGDQGYTLTAVFDPATMTATERKVTETAHDMFCPGTARLADGRLLVNGGSSSARTSLYDPTNATWTAGATMNLGRGYHASTLLGNGSVLTVGGSWSGVRGGKDGELWTAEGGWRPLPGVKAEPMLGPDPGGIYRSDNHFWLFTMAGGRVLQVGPSAEMHWIDVSGDGQVTPAGPRGDDAYSINGTAAAFDTGHILKAGGAPAYENAAATASAQVVAYDGNSLSVRRVAPMAYARGMHNSVVLPNGEVLLIGGLAAPRVFTDDASVLVPELWNPVSEVFTRLAPMGTPRNYHSVAILLQDGRVFVGGGGLCGPCAVNHRNAEILTPPYLLNADGTAVAARPAIVEAPAQVQYGQAIPVTTSGPTAGFALVRLSIVTHSINNDQRRMVLRPVGRDVRRDDGAQGYTLTLPADPGVAPPGDYWLFALDVRGVPSIGHLLRLAPAASGKRAAR
ncbi:RICIN domain-containing protein [Caldimonas brevitalea]|uniref:Galactose oxidase n=1 Tax=Caldimonas brevitalea TaxID=413882 RepID=A0A0G3BM04_9BURK|nr:RICIN domain-containing protein [Caldimonas brevitalea]AKJ27595.1 galactose oxidase [Caldimonas brevitalea]